MNVNDYETANLLALEVYADERASLTERLKSEFVKVITSPVPTEATVYFVEFVYANAANFSASSREKAADVSDFATGKLFYGLHLNERGDKIAKILRGEVVENPPEYLTQFVFNKQKEQ